MSEHIDLKALALRLEQAFEGAPIEVAGGQIVWCDGAVPLWQLVEEMLTEEGREEHGNLEDWPASVAEILEGHLVPLLFFYWDGFGPTSSVAGMEVLKVDGYGYLCQWDEISSYRALARLEPWDEPSVLQAVVTGLLRENGRPHCDYFFLSVPTETTNRCPDMLPKAVIKDAYFEYLQSADPGAWDMLAQEHFSRIVEPNPLTRSLDMLAVLPQLDEPGAVQRWLEESEAASAEMDEVVRRRLLDEWFEVSYEEVGV